MGMSSGMGAETDADARVDVNNGSRQGGASRQFESLSGTWAGIFSHSDMFDPNTKVKEWQFTAQLSHEDNSFSGYISDTLGEARVKGVVEYPLVRFSKSYQASNSSMWSVGKNLGTVYYEGRVNEDGETMTGKWFRYPLELNSYGGSWWMVLEGRDAHGKVLVPRKAEADA